MAASARSADPAAPARRTRKSAAVRREEIIEAAIVHFATTGYNGTSTEAIARDAGISQPYLFRLFRTKRELFVACYDRMCERLAEIFREAAAAAPPEEIISSLGKAYIERLLPDRTMLLMQMQAYAACSDPEIQAHVRRRYVEQVRDIQRLTGADTAKVWSFFSHGMLLNVAASLDLQAIAGEEPWLADWLDPGAMIAQESDDAGTGA